jgi:neurofibromin 1
VGEDLVRNADGRSDNSTALLLVTLVVTILNTASSDAEKLVLYRFLAEASVEVPDVVSMA